MVSGDGFDNFVGHILRVRSAETDAHFRGSLSHHSEQSSEAYHRSVGLLKAVAVNILSQQSGFFEALGAKVGEFVENALGFARAFAAASVGHDAVRAEIVATTHNANKTAHAIARDARGNYVAISLGERKVYIDGFFAVFGSGNEVG